MATFLAGAMVVLAALYLLGFGVLAVAAPARASEYLHGFAGSFRLHVLELIARLIVGAAFVGYASHMPLGGVFYTFGLVLVITTLGLAVLPWRWHQRFAQTSVPAAVHWLPFLGIASIAAGAFVC
ncbi:MAG: hypothetical protein M3418_02765, partial [Gemmatimonadota bacterium]|nr:hypothetical protein [Gemmatimonadota bacterium]